MFKWLVSQSKNTCPFCRRKLFSCDLDLICTEQDRYRDDIYRLWCSLRVRLILRTPDELIDADGRKKLILGERHLYRRLIRAGAGLPRLAPRCRRSWLSDETEEALLEELQARGAFNIKVLQPVRTSSCPLSDEDIWDILRLEKGGIWRPRMMQNGTIVDSGWTLADGSFLESVDTEAYRGQIANSRGVKAPR